MALTSTNSAQMSFVIELFKDGIDQLASTKAKLDECLSFAGVNNLNGIAGQAMPSGFILTSNQITDMAYQLFAVRTALVNQLSTSQAALDAFRENVGVQVGTG